MSIVASGSDIATTGGSGGGSGGGGGSSNYKGDWDASTNTPTLANGTGTSGDYYRVSVAGSVDFGGGSITFSADDHVAYNGAIWYKLDNSWVASEILTDGTFTPNTGSNAGAGVSVKENLQRLAGTKQTTIIANDNLYKGFFQPGSLNTPSPVLKTIEFQNQFQGGGLGSESKWGNAPIISTLNGAYEPRKPLAFYTTLERNERTTEWALQGISATFNGYIIYNINTQSLEIFDGTSWLPYVEDSIANGVTTRAPSQNAVFDALALKSDKIPLTTVITTAGGTTILTTDIVNYRFTGTTTQTARLPNATTLTLNVIYTITNLSTGKVTIQNNGSVSIVILNSGESLNLQLTANGDANGTWATIGKQVPAVTPLFIPSSGGATNLSFLDSNEIIVTGTLTHTVRTPNALTIPLYSVYRILNRSSQQVTLQNIGGSSLGLDNLSFGQSITLMLTDAGSTSGTWIPISVANQSSALNSSRAVITNANGSFSTSTTTSTEIGYLSGATSNIQTQLNNKLSALSANNGLFLNGSNIGLHHGCFSTNTYQTINSTAGFNIVGGVLRFANGNITVNTADQLWFNVANPGFYLITLSFRGSSTGSNNAISIGLSGSGYTLITPNDNWPYFGTPTAGALYDFTYQRVIQFTSAGNVKPQFSQWGSGVTAGLQYFIFYIQCMTA